MANKFNEGDRVVVTAVNHSQVGVQGNVSKVDLDRETYLVDLETGRTSGFFEKELEPVDEKAEALIRLAETLDTARLQANASDAYTIQSQNGVYGQIAQALLDTLEVIFVDHVDDHNLFANLAYNSLLDGNTVREALASVVKK